MGTALKTNRCGVRAGDTRPTTVGTTPLDTMCVCHFVKTGTISGMSFFNDTDLRAIPLWEADLAGSVIMRANLDGANLRCANLTHVRFQGDTNWQSASFELANVTNVEPPDIQEFALKHHAVRMSDADWEIWREGGYKVTDDNVPILGRHPHGKEAVCEDPPHRFRDQPPVGAMRPPPFDTVR